MTTERAIEILDPTHREHYDSLKTVEEACRMGMAALEKQIPKKTNSIYTENVPGCEEIAIFGMCSCCNNEVQKAMNYCSICGQALDWEADNE